MNNRIFIKARFLPCTDYKPNRIKFIQSNTGNYIITSKQNNSKLEYLDFIKTVIKSCSCVEDVSILVDNTQNKEYLILIKDTDNGYGFPDVIQELKGALK